MSRLRELLHATPEFQEGSHRWLDQGVSTARGGTGRVSYSKCLDCGATRSVWEGYRGGSRRTIKPKGGCRG